MAIERDSVRKAYVQLQMQTLKEKAKLDAESTALRVRCLQAESGAMELKEKVDILEQKGRYRESPTTTLATLGPYSYPALGELGRRLTAQASPQSGRGMSELGLPHVPTPPSAGRGLSVYLAWTGTGSAGSTPSPGTGLGLSALTPSPYLGAPNANAGQAQGPGRAMDTEGESRAPEASAVTTGASSTMTN